MKSIYNQAKMQHKAITSILLILYILFSQAAYAIVMPESFANQSHLRAGAHSLAGDNDAVNSKENIEYSNIDYASYINQSVYALKSSYEFILFYRSTCPHCVQFDPILKKYSDITGIHVVAFTTDGVALPSFPESIPISNQVIAQYFGAGAQIFVPTLFILNVRTSQAFPVSQGEMTLYDLVVRMNEFAPKVLNYGSHAHV